LARAPNHRAEDDDQQIRAVVLDLRTGKVAQQAEWRMHDRSQYLWPYKDGKFLVRLRDTLFVTDPTLTLEPFVTLLSVLRTCVTKQTKDMRYSEGEPL
jgi:hypothetical protein